MRTLPTINEPVTVPPEIEQVDPAATRVPEPVIVQVASVGLKPVPDTDIEAPLGPDEGDRVTTRGIMF